MRFFRLRPMALFGLVFFLCSVSATYLDRLWIVAGAAAAAIVFLAVLAVLSLCRTDDKERKQTRLAILSLLLAPVLALSLSAWRSWHDETVVPTDESVRAECVVRSRSDVTSGSAQYIVAVRSVDGERASFTASVLLGDRSYAPGDVLRITGSFLPAGSSYPEGERRLRSLGAVAECDPASVVLVGEDHSPASVLGRLREKIAARIAVSMGENAPLVTALVTGEKSAVDPSLRRAFFELGVSHLLTVSGVHMSVIASAVALFARPFGRKRHYAVIAAVLVYAAVSGFALSAVRAAAMFAICSLAGLFGRRTDSVSLVALSAVIIVIASPGAVWDVGFLLSVFSVAAICASPFLWHTGGDSVPTAKRLFRSVIASIATTATVSLVTLPITAREYGAISLAAPIANLIFIPLVTPIIYVAPVFLAATFVPYLGGAVGSMLDFYCSLVVRLARWMGGARTLVSLDLPVIGVLAVLLCVFFFAALVAERKRLPAILACATVAAMIFSGAVFEISRADEVTVLASASPAGDMIAVSDGPSLYIVDCARANAAYRRKADELRRSFASVRIAKYVFTHVHRDSDVYLSKLLASARVDAVVLPAPRDDPERDLIMKMAQIAVGAGVTPELIGETVTLGNAALEVRTVCDLPYSVDPVVALTVSVGGRSLGYVGAGLFDAPDEARSSVDFSGTDALIVGLHGGAEEFALPAGYEAVVLTEGEDYRVTWEK